MSESIVLVEKKNAVATVTLNRPDRLNAMNKAMIALLAEILEDIESDSDVRTVVLTGAGRGFCSGGDLETIDDDAEVPPVEDEIAELRDLHRVSLLLRGLPQPVVAAVNGACAGAGLSWAAAADLRIAKETAVFRTSFASAGLTGDFGLTWTLPRLVGAGVARELYLLNPKVDAARALQIGLVNEVVAEDAWESRIDEIARQLANSAPLAMAGIKANLNESDTSGFADHLDNEAERHVRAARTNDCAEAVSAFLDRRTPAFTGT